MKHRKLLNSELGRPSVEEYKKQAKYPVVVVLDNIRSMFNVGAAFRCVDAFGVKKMLLCGICATPPSAEIHKSALGAELSVDWSYFPHTSDAIEELKREGYKIAVVEQAEGSISLENFRDIISSQSLPTLPNEEFPKIALVFGNEVFGVEQGVVNESDFVIEIPQVGTKHSINVSVSVGVVLWEIFRLFHLKK